MIKKCFSLLTLSLLFRLRQIIWKSSPSTSWSSLPHNQILYIYKVCLILTLLFFLALNHKHKNNFMHFWNLVFGKVAKKTLLIYWSNQYWMKNTSPDWKKLAFITLNTQTNSKSWWNKWKKWKTISPKRILI